MTAKVFLTGATGFIGGAVLAQLHDDHPDYDLTLFVRNEERGRPIAAKYPNVSFVYGNLDDSAVIEKAAAEADIVIHTANSADDAPSAKAIAKGIAAGHTAEKPGYWIHLSGTGILTWYDSEHKRFGEAPVPEETYNDLEGIDRLLNLPDNAPHRDIDKIVQAASSDAVKILIVGPPTIYGTGRGLVNSRSVQVPNLARATFQFGYAPIVGSGKTEWDNVHIDDLAKLFVKFVEASQDPSKRDNPEVFGRKGYYFARQSSHKWSDVATWIAEEASRRGYAPGLTTKSVPQEDVTGTGLVSAATWGANSKGEAERAKKYLGWEPAAIDLKETIAEVVELEAKALGLTPKGAKS
ncbi:hypothetical protein B0J13DRAFT_618865 [Dactylonectria estremocensis]|uniref:NAD(P)-binding domain-containing protein n=1 Tax=Dactylonectria estremocensis TaxID=1079267 RepID=A0A9P9JCC0_9HYPO|nr:hypothetical protein B0J13DRAFT_618865 [Dactylonectria estremocensis]